MVKNKMTGNRGSKSVGKVPANMSASAYANSFTSEKKKHKSGKIRIKKMSWKKGQSSSFNSKVRQHRDEAKRRGFGSDQGSGHLTQHALAQHDNFHGNQGAEEDEDDAMSDGKTFVTTFSECSNPAFNRLMKHWQSKSLLHKEMLAVLAAVTEVIKLKGGKETETEYFAALMAALSIVENDEALTAVITLLYMVTKRLPVPVLRVKFSESSKIFVNLLGKYMNSDYNALLRNLVGCLFQFLKAQVPVSWDKSTTQIYGVLLEFTTHQKPKVRKTAHNAVVSILCYSDMPSNHPAASATAQFVLNKMEASGNSASPVALHLLGLLKDVIGTFPKASLKTCCETVLRIMTLSDNIITSCCLNTFLGLFNSKPKPESLPTELNAKLVTALYDYQPNLNDAASLLGWLSVMEKAFVNLYRLDSKLCISHLPHFFNMAVKCWTSNQPEVLKGICESLKDVLRNCIDPSSIAFQELLQEDPVNNPMTKMFYFVENALSYQYHAAWKEVLIVLSSFFDIMGKQCYPVMIKCLQSIADLRDSYRFTHIKELDKAIGFAILRMGPQVVLDVLPLGISGENDKMDFPRSWLLPLLRDNVRETKLGFFTKYFLPLAVKIRNKVSQLEEAKSVVASATYKVLLEQIWSLLPGFCTKPTDLKESFPGIARILGTILKDDKNLGGYILSSLRLLVNKNLDDDENKMILADYAKNYLPILFNIYTTEFKNKIEEHYRLSVYDTINVYLQITDKKFCVLFFNNTMEKAKSSDATLFTQHALMDLNRAILPYVGEQQVRGLYEFCKPLLQDLNRTIQKKSYAVMKLICSSSSEACAMFIKNSLDELKSVFVTSLSSAAPSSKFLRLSCIVDIIRKLDVENKEFVSSIIPEVVLCTKENSAKTRIQAYNLLTDIGRTLKKWNPDDRKDALRGYMKMLLAGLAGSAHLMSATVLAIAHVFYEFRDDIDSDLMDLLIENICILLTSNSREVIESALSFIKSILKTTDTRDLAQHLEYLIKALVNIFKEHQRHFRFKAKEIFTRLIRKFGFEMIAKLVPENLQKQLTNIRKTEARKARWKKENPGEEYDSDEDLPKVKGKSDLIDDILKDSDEEMDDSTTLENERKVSKRKGKHAKAPWIEEQVNDIVDFLDPSARSKILDTKPSKTEGKAKSTTLFPTDSDGRLIISEIEEESKGKGKRKASNDFEDHLDEAEDLEDLEDLMDEFEDLEVDKFKFPKKELKMKKGKKRKLNDSSALNVGDGNSGYQPGGTGIHRPVGNSNINGNPGSNYKARKAGGDTKKGKFEPFAYLPLNKQVLNKRQRGKLGGQYNSIVKGAKKGARHGAKLKAKNAKRKA